MAIKRVARQYVEVLAADVANAHATPETLADVTGLAFAVVAGEVYEFEARVVYNSAAATTGARFTINGPASPTLLAYESHLTLTASTSLVNTGLGAYQLPALSSATSIAAASNLAVVRGIIKPSVAGTVQLQFASEVTASAITAKAGSTLKWRRIS